MRHVLLLLTFGVGLMLAGCTSRADYQSDVTDPELLHRSVWTMTDVMVHDIFSPPQAARAYAYASVAAYEALVPSNPGYQTMAGQLNELAPVPAPPAEADYEPSIASTHAFLLVATDKVFTQSRMEAFHERILSDFREMGIPQSTYERSLAYGEQVATHILKWSKTDGYRQTRSAPKFTVTDEPGRWQPTPPAYIDAIEPSWAKHRPFVLKDADQFKPEPPHPYSLEKGSPFYEQLMEVYRIGSNPSEEEREIAAFWDCNPYVMHTQGHAMFATKQMSPGGHWMGIAIIANRKTGADFVQSAETLARVSVALADGFISAWDEKYRSNLVRPETVINNHIDESWRPILQTPPFPEYTSAHSVISAAAATTLSDQYGESFAFADTTENAYGLPTRSFDSFMEAAREAAVSRIYGGIHYRMAAENGTTQGLNVGEWVVENIHTRTATADVSSPPEASDSENTASSDASPETTSGAAPAPSAPTP